MPSVAMLPLQEDQIPDEFYCPITGEVMKSPLMTVDGFNFEREAIFEWLQHHSTCPLSRRELCISKLVSNFALKARIRAWCVAHDMMHLLEDPENRDRKEDPSLVYMGFTLTEKEEREMQKYATRRGRRLQRALARFARRGSAVVRLATD